ANRLFMVRCGLPAAGPFTRTGRQPGTQRRSHCKIIRL
ncbi:MAG: hypothetical protein AVDCRST_MAG56-6015, partial [uncultured Cytophagales bacterium]